MTTNHIDQLTQWWETAEKGVAEKGDTVINRSDGETTVYVAAERARHQHPNTRILARAPKPKPAWRDAVAVMAALDVNSYDGWSDGYWPERRELWVRDGEAWESVAGGITVPPERLIDPTPLIEAKVTDEAMQRAFIALDPVLNRHLSMTKDDEEYVRYIVAAALGLDPA